MFIEDILEMKNKRHKYIILIFSITIGILTIFFLPALCGNFKLKMQADEKIEIKSTRNYHIINEKGQVLDALIFINRKTTSGQLTKELIVYFNMHPKPYVVSIAISPKLIGIPERSGTMKVNNGILTLRKESLRFTPINVGIEKVINNWSIEDDLIAFDTFDKLLPLGKRIVIKRNKGVVPG